MDNFLNLNSRSGSFLKRRRRQVSTRCIFSISGFLWLILFTTFQVFGQQSTFLEARNAYQSGEYAQALEKLQPLLSDKVEDAEVFLLSGDIHSALTVKDSF